MATVYSPFLLESPRSDDNTLNDIQCIRDGTDPEASDRLVASFGPLVKWMLSRYIFNPADVEELSQEAWLRCFANLGTFDTEREFNSWLSAIARNLAIDFLRTRKRRGTMRSIEEDDGRHIDLAAEQSLEGESFELHEEIEKVLNSRFLHNEAQMDRILTLSAMEGLMAKEIADILGSVPTNTVQWRLFEARKRFAEIWRRREGQNDTPSSSDQRRLKTPDAAPIASGKAIRHGSGDKDAGEAA